MSPTATSRAKHRDRIAQVILAVAIVAHAALILHLTRGAAPTFDSMAWIVHAEEGFAPSSILEPHNGHLIAITRFLYAGTLRLFGPSQVAIETYQTIAVAATAVMLFILLRRRIDGLLALVPTLIVLFLGSSVSVIDPNMAVFAQSTALGLGAILALERDGRLGDALGCLLLLLGVLAFSAGVPIAIGIGALIAAGRDPLRRSWIVAGPLIAYVAWAIWARSEFGGGQFELGGGGPETGALSNVLLAPAYSVDSLAAGLAAFAGLGRDLLQGPGSGVVDLSWGRPLALIFLALLGWMIARGARSRVALALGIALVVYWTLGALNTGYLRPPSADRYAFPVVVFGSLLFVELLPRFSVTRQISIGALVLLAFALPGNLSQLRFNGAAIRMTSDTAKARLAALELERPRLQPSDPADADLLIPVSVGDYFAMVDAYGTFAYAPEQLPSEDLNARQQADDNLRRILQLQLVAAPEPGRPPSGCSVLNATGGDIEFDIPPGGALLRSSRGGELRLKRFGDDGVLLARLPADRYGELAIPTDSSSQPWTAEVSEASSIRICPIQQGGSPA